MKTNEQKIYDIVVKDQLGRIDYLRGKNYDERLIELKEVYETESTRCTTIQVESESDYTCYDVEIRNRKGDIIGTHCTCPRYSCFTYKLSRRYFLCQFRRKNFV